MAVATYSTACKTESKWIINIKMADIVLCIIHIREPSTHPENHAVGTVSRVTLVAEKVVL